MKTNLAAMPAPTETDHEAVVRALRDAIPYPPMGPQADFPTDIEADISMIEPLLLQIENESSNADRLAPYFDAIRRQVDHVRQTIGFMRRDNALELVEKQMREGAK